MLFNKADIGNTKYLWNYTLEDREFNEYLSITSFFLII